MRGKPNVAGLVSVYIMDQRECERSCRNNHRCAGPSCPEDEQSQSSLNHDSQNAIFH